jgi:hypothetical protein
VHITKRLVIIRVNGIVIQLKPSQLIKSVPLTCIQTAAKRFIQQKKPLGRENQQHHLQLQDS